MDGGDLAAAVEDVRKEAGYGFPWEKSREDLVAALSRRVAVRATLSATGQTCSPDEQREHDD